MLEIEGMAFPLDRKYYFRNGSHLWLKEDGDIVKVGMDAFAAEMVGFLSFLTVAKKHAEEGEAIGSFESAKFVSRLRSPVTGDVVELNEQVINNPRKINEDPYESWILAMKPDDPSCLEGLLAGEGEIRKWISDELKRQETA